MHDDTAQAYKGWVWLSIQFENEANPSHQLCLLDLKVWHGSIMLMLHNAQEITTTENVCVCLYIYMYICVYI